LVAASALANEALLGVAGSGPIWWAICYFPLRTVFIPVAGLIVAAWATREAVRSTGRGVRAASLLALALGGGAAVFCWRYPRMLFFEWPTRSRAVFEETDVSEPQPQALGKPSKPPNSGLQLTPPSHSLERRS
jgi:hypothetical protein